MSQIQHDQDDEIQAFHRWSKSSKTRRPGIGGSSHATRCDFIPSSAVKEYLGANDRVEGLLASLFDKETIKTIDAEFIRRHLLRTLAILLLIGEGPMIKYFIQYQSLQDHRLPYRSRPLDFPSSSSPNFFDRFHNHQWQFCATDLEYNMNVRLHKEQILPIVHKEEIGRGGNGTISKVVVDEEYNRLVPPRWKMPERPPHLRNTFVLKTYRGADAKERHEAERKAFMNLRFDNKPSPFIVAYYGSFIDDDTYNIILEHADRDNLEEFMKITPEPSTREEILEFWDRLCSVTHGLALIHGTPGSTPTNIPVLLGWHQDIKPANILVFSGSGSSSYDVYFKLADLSLCHFKRCKLLQHEDYDLDAFGTRAYGAPETFRPDDTVEAFPVQVRPDVDIWSMGCVFSEAAVWSCFGWYRVLEYRRRRQDEVKKLLDLDGEHLFHDGHDVLPIVQDIHEHIIKTARDIDHITIEILRLVNEEMLLKEGEPRYSAKQVFHKSKRIVEAARKKIGAPTIVVSASKEMDIRITSGPEGRPKTPPYVPPGYVGSSRASSRNLRNTDSGIFSAAAPALMSGAQSHLHGLQNATASRHSRGKLEERQNRHKDYTFGPFHSDSIDLQSLPDLPSPTTSYGSSHVDRSSAFWMDTQDLDHTRGRRLPQHETMVETSRGAGDTVPDKKILRRSQTEIKQTNQPRHSSVEYLHNSFSDHSLPIQDPIQDPKPSTMRDSSSSNHPPLNLSLGTNRHTPSEFKKQEPQEEPKPHLSLDQGLLWKERRKKKGYQSALHGEENLTYLSERDHIFIIDNTESMRVHRKNVSKVVSLLTYMLKDSDSDGLDVCFTQSTLKVNSRKSTKLSDAISHVPFQGTSDMRTRLSHILQEYKNKFGTVTTPSEPWYKRTRRPEAQKPLSFYILTNGIWQPNEVGPIIISLVDSMRAKQLPKEHVGIQFIRFGEDPHGVSRLNHLDRGLGLKGIDMDIVDTTPWNGNIWKQLLGALNSWYDDDPD